MLKQKREDRKRTKEGDINYVELIIQNNRKKEKKKKASKQGYQRNDENSRQKTEERKREASRTFQPDSLPLPHTQIGIG